MHSSLVHTFAYKISHINIHSQRRIALHNINHKYESYTRWILDSTDSLRKAVQRKRNCGETGRLRCWHKIFSLPFYSSFRLPVMQPIPERDLHYQTSVACCPCTHSQHPVWRLASSLEPRTSFAKIRSGIPPLATVPIVHLKSFLDWMLRAISIIKQPRPLVGEGGRKKERKRVSVPCYIVG